jgi:hypothetical protein
LHLISYKNDGFNNKNNENKKMFIMRKMGKIKMNLKKFEGFHWENFALFSELESQPKRQIFIVNFEFSATLAI